MQAKANCCQSETTVIGNERTRLEICHTSAPGEAVESTLRMLKSGGTCSAFRSPWANRSQIYACSFHSLAEAFLYEILHWKGAFLPRYSNQLIKTEKQQLLWNTLKRKGAVRSSDQTFPETCSNGEDNQKRKRNWINKKVSDPTLTNVTLITRHSRSRRKFHGCSCVEHLASVWRIYTGRTHSLN